LFKRSSELSSIYIRGITVSQINVHYIGCCNCNSLCLYSADCLTEFISGYQLYSVICIIGVGQSFGSTEPPGTAPNINVQYEFLITRIIRSVESVKQGPLRLTQQQILHQNGEQCIEKVWGKCVCEICVGKNI
jgi:hypothetical protein